MTEMIKKFLQNTCKPQGLMGRMMTVMMNNGHARLAEWGFSHLKFRKNMDVLDIGCGGGANVSVLLRRCPEGKVTGMDYSSVCVSQSKKKNQKAAAAGRCRIVQASAEKIPFADNSFDLITAFETVYFWPDLGACIRNIYGKLRRGGVFLICNEDSDPADDRWTKIIDGMRVYSEEELRGYLKEAGFTQISVDRMEKKGWLCVWAKKELL